MYIAGYSVIFRKINPFEIFIRKRTAVSEYFHTLDGNSDVINQAAKLSESSFIQDILRSIDECT